MNLISINNLSKSFRTYPSEVHRFLSWFGVFKKSIREKWILRKITFNVEAGDALGIVGQNGAGKSTLLKLIAGTLSPTNGSVFINGKVSAILELGMGFDQNQTGRQNVYNTLSLMGYNKSEIESVIEKIKSFSEIGDYFDKAVWTYSSGMTVRLAFSVATAFRPEILIVDEALSVGDSYFQHKSFSKIKEFQQLGTSLLIVSHDRQAIQTLCNKAVLIEKGDLIKEGAPEEVFDYYNAIISKQKDTNLVTKKLESGQVQTTSGTGEVKVVNIVMINESGLVKDTFEVGEEVVIKVKIKAFSDIEELVFGFSIKDRLGQVIYGTNTWYTDQLKKDVISGDEITLSIEFALSIGVGSYSVQTALTNGKTHLGKNYEWRDLSYLFKVINSQKNHFEGLSWIEPKINFSKIEVL